MKFAQHLDAHLTPEWRKQYIVYEELKKLIYDIQAGLPPESDQEARHCYLNIHIDEFLERCREELVRIELFFFEKLKEAERRLNNLQQEVAKAKKLPGGETTYLQDGSLRTDVRAVIRRSTTYLAAKQTSSRLKDLKLAFTEFYLNLVLVQQFQSLNREGFRKILKKFDKVLNTNKGSEWRSANVLPAPFATDTKINDLIEKTEFIFIDLEGGNRSKAMNRLRVLPITEQQSPWTTFFLGLYLGMLAILILVIILSKAYRNLPGDPPWIWVRLFRGFLIFYLNVFLIGCNMYVWQRQGVNHVLIFEIDPRNHLTYQQLMEVAAFFLVFLAVCALAYLYADYFGVPRLVFPLFFLGMNLLWLLNPFNFWYRSSRTWFLREAGHLLTPVCRQVKFPDFWLADQINSLVTFFLDMQYFVCFYSIQVDWTNDMAPVLLTANQTRFSAHGIDAATGADTCSTNIYGIRPVIAIVPAMIRFWQCLRRYRDNRRRHPFLTNAGKYATTFFVVLFGTLNSVDKHERGLGPGDYNVGGALFYFWILAYVISTTYTFLWDVLQDWSLGDRKYQFLRQELIYPHKAYYYAAIVSDVVLRFGWALNITLLTEVYDWGDVVICVTALLECARRFVWNFFRLENEHVNNCGEFRAVRDINLRPIPRQMSGESGAGNDDTILPKLNKAKRSVIQLFHLGGVNNPMPHHRPSSARDLVEEERRMLANDVELAAVKHRNHLSKEI